MKSKYERENFTKAVNESFSVAEVCRKIGLKPLGSNYETIAKYIREYELDTSHFTGQRWNFEKSYTDVTSSASLEDILKEGTNYKSQRLKQRLITEGIKENKCDKCGCDGTWQGEPITLELHHINGNHYDNRLENLQILCPNCHSQTPTHKRRLAVRPDYIPNPNRKEVGFKLVCKNCGKEFIADRQKRTFCCTECYTTYLHQQHQVKKENKDRNCDDLVKLANECSTITELSEKLQVSRPIARKMLVDARLYQKFKEDNKNAILHTKSILQYDLNGHFIKEWQSIADASRELKLSHINHALRGIRKQVGGYIWKYKKDIEGAE